MASNSRLKQLLHVMNPSKLCTGILGQIPWRTAKHSLKLYADILDKLLVYGQTPGGERQAMLGTLRAQQELLECIFRHWENVLVRQTPTKPD